MTEQISEPSRTRTQHAKEDDNLIPTFPLFVLRLPRLSHTVQFIAA